MYRVRTPTSLQIDSLLDIVHFVECNVLARGIDCMSENTCNYLQRFVWPKLRCLRYHHEGKLDRFVVTVGPAMKFSEFGCSGRTPKCSAGVAAPAHADGSSETIWAEIGLLDEE